MAHNERTFGTTVAELRRERGMTQLELANRMGVTDKAVSKWERDLSLPDVESVSRLAEVLGVSADELLGTMSREPGAGDAASPLARKVAEIADLALKAVALAMGVAVAVLSVLGSVTPETALPMLGIGLACLAATQLPGD